MKKIVLKSLFCLFLCATTCFHSSVHAMEIAVGFGISALVVWSGKKLYGWWNSPDFGELNRKIIVGNSPCEGREVCLSDDGSISIAQIKVLGQFESDAGGGASCGFHSLKNAAQALISLYAEANNLKQLVHDPTIINNLFGKDGAWRNQIIYQRLKTAYNAFLLGQLRSYFRPNLVAEIRNQYDQVLQRYRNHVVEQLLANGQPVPITFDDFFAFLNTQPEWCLLQNLGEIDYCFDRNRFNSVIRLEDASNVADCYRRQNNGRNLYINGEWLDKEEIERLIRQNPGMLGPEIYTVIEDMNDFNAINILNDPPEGEYDPPERRPLGNVYNKLREENISNYIHCFILGTMSRDIKEGQKVEKTNDGHWLAVVVHKENGRRRYIVADSANRYRLYSDPVRSLIAHLEGQETAQRLLLTQEDLRYLENILRTTMENQNCPQDKRNKLLEVNAVYQERGGDYQTLGVGQDPKDEFLARLENFVRNGN